MEDIVKKLTAKVGYEEAASHIINSADVKSFCELVEKDDVLFDFVKQNVANRLEKECNETNYINLLEFLDCYSPFYDDFITRVLAKYADEDLTDRLLDLLESGTDNQKAYCAKYFSYIQDNLAIDALRKNSYSEFSSLAQNCAATLAAMNDIESYNNAIEKLHSEDNFESYAAVKFLVSYGKSEAISEIFKVMKNSGFAEHIASEVPYLVDFSKEIMSENRNDILLALCYILDGLGEIIPVSCVFDIKLYEVFNKLIKGSPGCNVATVLLMAKEKFNILTENDEYLYDEDKNTKNEIFDIKNMLNQIDENLFKNFLYEELDNNFLLFSIRYIDNVEQLRAYLKDDNQTVVLKSLELLKALGEMTDEDKTIALSSVTDENIKFVVEAM